MDDHTFWRPFFCGMPMLTLNLRPVIETEYQFPVTQRCADNLLKQSNGCSFFVLFLIGLKGVSSVKPWYKSKTVWTNVLALLITMGVDLQEQDVVEILAVINLVLRIVTKEKLTL